MKVKNAFRTLPLSSAPYPHLHAQVNKLQLKNVLSFTECLKEVENDYNSLLSLKASMEEECRSVTVKTESLQEVREQRKKTMQE